MYHPHEQKAIEKACRVFRCAQDDVLSLSYVAEVARKHKCIQMPGSVPCLPTYYAGRLCHRHKQSPKTECKPSVPEPEPPFSEAKEEANIPEGIKSATAADEKERSPTLVVPPHFLILFIHQPPTKLLTSNSCYGA